jgi:hypothetical protein
MSEWTVVTVIVVLIGLLASVLKPLIHLNGTLTRLTEAVRVLERELTGISDKNSEAHARLWKKAEEQDERLLRCECRVAGLGGK